VSLRTQKLRSTVTGLILTVAVVLGAPATDGAAAADCAWQKHAKRVVKKVKRHGKVKRVVRWRHWWSCDAVAAQPALGPLPAPAPAATPTPAPIPQPSPEPEPPPRRVSVKAEDEVPEEFSFGLSRPFVVAGDVTVELNNSEAQDPHNLNLRREGGAEAPLEVGEAEQGERRVAHFDLSAGTYRLWCSLPQHEEWGMSVSLEVRASWP
jgi:hypothetical protein